jgi:hypothetical protein
VTIKRVELDRCDRRSPSFRRSSSVVVCEARGRQSVGGRARPGKAVTSTLIVVESMLRGFWFDNGLTSSISVDDFATKSGSQRLITGRGPTGRC